MADLMRFEAIDGVGIVTIDSPPVNALGHKVRLAIDEGMRAAIADDSVKAIILICAGRTFFAGADITEFNKPFQSPDFVELNATIEDSGKPVIAAIHGTALGGGFELALNCHYRIAVPSAKFGLPEVHLGILPGAGGTQRLPRLIGIPDALELILTGRPTPASKGLKLGVIDKLAEEGKLREDAIAYARTIISENKPIIRLRDREDMIAPYRGKHEIYADIAQKYAPLFRGFKAPAAILKAVQAAADLPFDDGMKLEFELFLELVTSVESAAQRHAFFSERETSKIPDIPRDTPLRDIRKVGIIGAGTMGGGIAMNFLNIGLPVILIEQKQEALDRGIGIIRKNYEGSVSKGRMTQEALEQCMSLIDSGLDYEKLADSDLVIEAVFESMPIKKDVFAKLDSICKKGAILASNTSFLDLDEIASATSRPEDVIGLHFFSPANIMPLLEIVRGKKTGNELVATALQLAKTIGKTPVVARVCHGFIANRAMHPYIEQAGELILEGIAPERVDRIANEYGFAMGPLQMMDLVGLDVLGRESNEKTVMSELVAHDRLGQKKNGGYYDYDEKRRPTPSAVAAGIIRNVAAEKGIKPKDSSDEDILARLLYVVINEGAKILEEGVAVRPSDIDIALIKGYNWPVYRGGPMFWADTIGLDQIVTKLRIFESAYGDKFRPCALLERLAAEGKTFAAL